jgi:GNAT superfamily N-acetyltransferase
MLDGLIEYRPLESDLFGIDVHAVAVGSPDQAKSACASTRARGTGLTVVRVPADSISTAQIVEAAGGALCDALVTLGRQIPLGGLGAEPLDVARLRLAGPNDEDALASLGLAAFSGYGGHWHSDLRLPSHLADELYARWARDLAKRAGHEAPVVVSLDPVAGVITAFLALRATAVDRWDVVLTGVHPSSRGTGTLRKMLAYAARFLSRERAVRLTYETQLGNCAALRVVGSCGFSLESARLTFHLWAGDQQ